MTTALSEDSTAIRQRPQLTNRRAESLATVLEQGARWLAGLTTTLTDEEWRSPLPGDGRTLGVIVHHVGSIYPLEIQLAQDIAAGKPITGVVWADVHALNARHAREHADVSRAEAMTLLTQNSTAAAAAIRALSGDELDSTTANSLYGGAPLTCQFMLEDHAVRHSYHHLNRIRAFVGR